jgi:hypothetical protein
MSERARTIDTLLDERRTFAPSAEFLSNARVTDQSLFTPDLPKTRSGKIMRRLLRDIAENRKLGDTTTLADSSIVADLQRRATEEEAKEQ